MQTELKELNNYTRELTIVITADEKKKYDLEALRKVKKTAELPGFRRGKVPEVLVRQHFAYEIVNESLNLAMDDIYPKAIEELHLPVVAPGKLKDVKEEADGLRFIFEVVVEPDIELVKVEGLKLKKIHVPIEEKHIDHTIEELRERYAVVEEKDGSVAEGDMVEIDLLEVDEAGQVRQKPLEEGLKVVVGSGSFDKDLENQLIGMKAGEQKVVEKVYPEDYEEEEWRGKREKYQVNLKKVWSRELPAIDDAFAQTVKADYNTVQEMRDDIRRRLEETQRKEEKNHLYNSVIQQMIEENPFDVPEEMIEDYLDRIVQDVKRQYGNVKIDDAVLRQYYRQTAENSVRWYLIRKKLIEKLQPEVSEEEVNQKIEELWKDNEKVRELALTDERYRETIREDLKEEKVFQYLIDHAELEEMPSEEGKQDEKKKTGLKKKSEGAAKKKTEENQ